MTSTRTPVVFIHGLWLHASSRSPWLDLFTEAGYAPVAPGWPGVPETVELARAYPDSIAGYGIEEVTTHYAGIIEKLPAPPVITKSTLKQYRSSGAVTDLVEFADRGHSLTIDSGWRAVADECLSWLGKQGL